MKKVCIITMYGDWNYGNKLQNYALQEVLKKMDCDVISLKNKYQSTLYNKIKNKYYQFRQLKKYILLSQRKKSFKLFNKQFMNYTDYSVTYTLKPKKAKNFDYFVIGSDQIWNYGEGTISDIMFGMFAEKEKNISYAASFGVETIPEKYKNIYLRGLNNIGNISVREEAGKDIIKNLINKEAKVVLDPTLLLDKNEWEKIERKVEFDTNKDYILTYFLGNLSEKKKEEISKVAKKENLNIISLNDINNKEFYKMGPREFLYLFHHAKLIFTDSFHACVFSLIYEKPFFVYERDENVASMNSRIDTLLEMTNEKDRLIMSTEKVKDLFFCDYKVGFEYITEKRKESIHFLEESLK